MPSYHDSTVKYYYDGKSASYDDYNRQLWCRVYDAVTWKITEPYVPRDSRGVVFDAAGGTGKWSIPIAKCGARVVLGDVSEGMLKVAREKIRRGNLPPPDVLVGDITENLEAALEQFTNIQEDLKTPSDSEHPKE